MAKLSNSLRDGTITKTLWRSHFGDALCHHIRSVFHALYVLGMTFVHNRRDEHSPTAYIGTFFIWLAIAVVTPIQVLNDLLNIFLNVSEMLIEIVLAIVIIPFVRSSTRSESVNTFLFFLEYFTGIEIQKTVYRLVHQPRERRHDLCRRSIRSKCFRKYRLGLYHEVIFDCDNCLEDFTWYKEHAVMGQGYEHISIRGNTISEVGNIFCRHRVLDDMLSETNDKGVIVYREYDVHRFLWKEVSIRRNVVIDTDIKATYHLHQLRTDVINLSVPWTIENVAIIQAYCEVCELQNKYRGYERTNKDKLYLKSAVSLALLLALLTTQLINGLMIDQITPSLGLVLVMQLAWLQVVSEILLSDEQSIQLDEHSMRKISVDRMCSIFYIAHGDLDRKYDKTSCSWANGLQYGSFDVKPVLALECLLGADHLITTKGAWSFNRSGAPVEQRKVHRKIRNGEYIWTVAEGRGFGPPGSTQLKLVPGFVGGISHVTDSSVLGGLDW